MKLPSDIAGWIVAPVCDAGYAFDFAVLDNTPGGRNLGRIQWQVEPFWSGRRIRGLLVWATQTRDPRYAGRHFWLPCHTEALDGVSSIRPDHSYMSRVWIIRACRMHRNLIFSAYPEDGETRLFFDLTSSISVTAEFQAAPVVRLESAK